MNFKIENFANINKIDGECEIIEKKFNFIYGISGAGKSSIASALSLNEEIDINDRKKIGSDNDVCINCEEDFVVFDEKSVNEYIILRTGTDGLYNIMMNEDENLKQIRHDIDDLLNSEEVLNIKNIIDLEIKNFENLISKWKVKIKKNGGLSSTGIIKDLCAEYDYSSENFDVDAKQRKWIRDGEKFYDKEYCPFCFQKIEDEFMGKILSIIQELPNNLQTVVDSKEILGELGIDVNNIENIIDKSERDYLYQQLNNHYIIYNDCKKIKNFLNIRVSRDEEIDSAKYQNFDIELSTIKFFNEINIDIKLIIDKLRDNNFSYLTYKKKYNSILKSNIKNNIQEINKDIKSFGIKYEFIKENIVDKEEEYKLKHIKDTNCNDSSRFLSTGEKNIIALILFLKSHQNENIIIDDPASSYDEYRRDKILDLILSNRKNKTTLVLSHDQIFLKFLSMKAINDKQGKFKDCIGNVYHFANNDYITEFKEINLEKDIHVITEHIKNNIKKILQNADCDFLRLMINIRLFSEIAERVSDVYKYSSAYLHGEDNDTIIRQLDNIGKSNNDMIEEIINMIFPDKKENEEIEIMKKILEKSTTVMGKKEKIDIENWSNFEKLCYVRENIGANDKKELDNIMHFNYGLVHMLNPYKFNFQSEKSYKILSENNLL